MQTTLFPKTDKNFTYRCSYQHCDMYGIDQVYSSLQKQCVFCGKGTLKLVVVEEVDVL